MCYTEIGDEVSEDFRVYVELALFMRFIAGVVVGVALVEVDNFRFKVLERWGDGMLVGEKSVVL